MRIKQFMKICTAYAYIPVIMVPALLWFTACAGAHAEKKVNLIWPEPPDTPRIKFINEFSSPRQLGIRSRWYQKVHHFITGKKEKTTKLISPYSICVDPDGDIYVTDTYSSSVHIFRKRKKKYETISSIGGISLASPIGIAVDDTGRIFVSDSILNCVFVTSKKGKHLFTIPSDHFKRPTGIAIDRQLKRLYVVDTLDHNIKVFDTDGAFLLAFGKNGNGQGEFHFPTSICLNREHQVIVGDSLNFRIQIFDFEGEYIDGFGEAGDSTGYFSKIKGVATDKNGHIYVCDGQYDVIQLFDTGGNLLLSFGRPGRLPGEFQFPAGIYIDQQNMIYVVDKLNRRVQIFKSLGSNHD